MRKKTEWPPVLPDGCPLTLTPRGYVARIRGKLRWICGKKPLAFAMQRWHKLNLAADLAAKPIEQPKRVGAVRDLGTLLRLWVDDRRQDCERGELSPNAFEQYRLSGIRIDEAIGYAGVHEWSPDMTRALYDRLAKRWGIDFAKRAMSHLRQACRHAADPQTGMGWCEMPKLGPVAKLAAREGKVEMKWKLYTPAQVRLILDKLEELIRDGDGRVRPSKVQLHSMVMLALNGGYGAKELGDMPRAVVDLDRGLIDYRRGKTGATHIVPLWPETITSLRRVLDMRPAEDPLLYRTREGNPWCWTRKRYSDDGKLVGKQTVDNVAFAFDEVVEPMGLKFPRSSFYRLKHLHSTAADAFDSNAAHVLRGHAIPGIAAHYVGVEFERLKRLTDHLRSVLLVQ